jgi:hypothetical protein
MVKKTKRKEGKTYHTYIRIVKIRDLQGTVWCSQAIFRQFFQQSKSILLLSKRCGVCVSYSLIDRHPQTILK